MNYSLILLAHIICADQQIHREEVRYLDELIKNNGADTATTEAIEYIASKILQNLSTRLIGRIQPSAIVKELKSPSKKYFLDKAKYL